MWESAGLVLSIVTPLVVVPLTIITFHLRSIREHQVTWQAQMLRRVEATESATTEFRRTLAGWEREYTTKEEWLREGMYTRRVLENLRESTIRIEATLAAVLPPRGDHRPGHAYDPTEPKGIDGTTEAIGPLDERRL